MDKDVDTFRAELATVLARYQGVLDALILYNAAKDMVERLTIPGTPMPEALTAPEVPGGPVLEPAA